MRRRARRVFCQYAIRLKPDGALAYYSRGIARRAKGDLEGALQDYTEAIRLKPNFALAYYDLKPDFATAYNNRGVARRDKGDLEGALQDYTEPSGSSPTLPLATRTGALRAATKAT